MTCPTCNDTGQIPVHATFARTGTHFAPGTKQCPACGGAKPTPTVSAADRLTGQDWHPEDNSPVGDGRPQYHLPEDRPDGPEDDQDKR